MATEPPKRRWFRFSLKTFVVVLTLFCVWLGLLVYRVNKQREAIQWVREHGGYVYYDYQFELLGGVIDDAEPPGPDWLRELIGVDYFADVAYVNLSGAKIDDIGPLRELNQMKWLFLDDTQVSDLAPLSELNQLETIFLDEDQQVTIPEELKDRVVRMSFH